MTNMESKILSSGDVRQKDSINKASLDSKKNTESKRVNFNISQNMQQKFATPTPLKEKQQTSTAYFEDSVKKTDSINSQNLDSKTKFYTILFLSLISCNAAFGADIILPLYDEAVGKKDTSINFKELKKDITNFFNKIFNNKDSVESKMPQDSIESIESNPKDSNISLHYLSGYMRHDNFDITLHGVGLEYNTILLNAPKSDMILTYQLNFSNANLKPFKDSIISQNTGFESIESTHDNSFVIGTFATLDVMLNQQNFTNFKGYHAISLDFGYSSGINGQSSASATRGVSEFSEHSLMLNAEYGYGFVRGIYTMIPYFRIESYVFFPNFNARKNFKRKIDGGMNAILGLKNAWDMKWLEFGLDFGALSDLNVSGNSVGVLANGSIVYDSAGMSNGIFAEFSIGILRYKHFHLVANTNFGYMLSYYELNIQSDLAFMWRF